MPSLFNPNLGNVEEMKTFKFSQSKKQNPKNLNEISTTNGILTNPSYLKLKTQNEKQSISGFDILKQEEFLTKDKANKNNFDNIDIVNDSRVLFHESLGNQSQQGIPHIRDSQRIFGNMDTFKFETFDKKKKEEFEKEENMAFPNHKRIKCEMTNNEDLCSRREIPEMYLEDLTPEMFNSRLFPGLHQPNNSIKDNESIVFFYNNNNKNNNNSYIGSNMPSQNITPQGNKMEYNNDISEEFKLKTKQPKMHSQAIQNELNSLDPSFSSSDLVIQFAQRKTKQATGYEVGDGNNYKSVNWTNFNSKLVNMNLSKLSEKQKMCLSNYSENKSSPVNSNKHKHKYLLISPIMNNKSQNTHHTPLRVLKRNQLILLSDLK